MCLIRSAVIEMKRRKKRSQCVSSRDKRIFFVCFGFCGLGFGSRVTAASSFLTSVVSFLPPVCLFYFSWMTGALHLLGGSSMSAISFPMFKIQNSNSFNGFNVF